MFRYKSSQLPWLAFALVGGAFVAVLLIHGGMEPTVAAIGAPVVGALVLLASGRLVMAMTGTSLAAGMPAAVVTGAACTSLAVLLLVYVGGMTASVAFGLWAVVVAAVSLLSRGRTQPVPATWSDVGVGLGMVVLVGTFCFDIAGFYASAGTGAILPAWTDYYLHGTVIASFGDPLAAAKGDILLAGVSRPFYHYGPFMLPAALLPSTGLPGLALATATLLPLGLLLALLGIYALLVELSGRPVAVLSLLALICFPDPSHYGMQNGLFGVQWLLYTAPGSGYALGISALVATCLLHSFREGRGGTLALGLLLLAGLVMTRIFFFVLLAPAFFATWLAGGSTIRLARRGLRRGLLTAWLVAIAFLLALLALAYSPHWRELVATMPYLDVVLSQGPTCYHDYVRNLRDEVSPVVAGSVGIGITFLAALGAFALAFPVVAWRWKRAGRWEGFDYLPVFLCLTFAWVAIAVPALGLEPSEFKQRHFLLLYAVVAGWTIARAVQLIHRRESFPPGAEGIAACGFAVAMLMVAVVGRDNRPAQPLLAHMPWARVLFDVPIEPGVAQAAAYIRSQAEPGDVVMMSGPAVRGDLISPLVELVSMADVPAYLSRTDMLERKGGEWHKVARERGEQTEAIVSAGSWSEACNRMRDRGIRWYVEQREGWPRWDPDHTRAAQTFRGYRVYDVDVKRASATTPCQD